MEAAYEIVVERRILVIEIECNNMLLNNESYKLGRNGKIHTHQRVTVSCDFCQKTWQTQYSNYKRRIGEHDLCQSCKNSAGICGMLGRKHETKTLEQFSAARKGKLNGFFSKQHTDIQKEKWSKLREGKAWRSPIDTEECKRISKRTKAYWDALSEEEKIARLSCLDYSIMRKRLLHNGGKYSKLHSLVKKDIETLGIKDFISEEKIGNYVADEVNHKSKIIIEINGDYWHANPLKYREDEIIVYPKKAMKASDIWKRDEKKIDYFRKQGYQVIIIWESDVKQKNHINLLKGLLNDTSESDR